MFSLVMRQLSIMAIIGVGGFIYAKVVKVQEYESKFLSKLLLYFINPFMIINSFNKEFNPEKFKQLLFVILLSLIAHLVMILLGFFSTKDKVDRLAVSLTNCGFVGIPLVRGVFGEEGVFFLMGSLVVFNIMVWTYGYYQIGGSVKIKKIITNPNIIAITFGLILYVLPVSIPEIIMKPINMIGDLNTAVSMILIGILLANFKFSESKAYIFQITKTLILRLIVTGILNIAVFFVIFKIFGNFPDIQLLIYVVLLASLCPVATSIPGLACVFNKDATYASVLVSISSLLCLFTLPAIVALAELVIRL